MPDQAEKCPLCGGEPTNLLTIGADGSDMPVPARYQHCKSCGEPVRNWPRVAELVADNTRLTEWEARAVASMDAACKAVGVECCDRIPARVAELVAIRDAAVTPAEQAVLDAAREYARAWYKHTAYHAEELQTRDALMRAATALYRAEEQPKQEASQCSHTSGSDVGP